MATEDVTQKEIDTDVDVTVDDLEEEITCPVCQELFQEPKILPCCHYYCKRCILALVEAAGTNRPFLCPECRSDTVLPQSDPDKLPTAFFVNRMMDLRTKMEKAYGKVKAHCEQCSESEAVAFCRQCAEFICKRCTEAHQKMKVFHRHRVTTLEELKTSGFKQIPAEQPHPPTCKVHDEQMKLYCYDCDCLICRDCIVIDHKEHKCEFVKKAAPEMKEKLAQQLAPLKRIQTSVSNALKAVESTKSDVESSGVTMAASIEKSFQKLHDIIEQRKRELLKQASKFVDSKFDRLSIQEKELHKVSGTVQSVVEFVERNIENMTDEELMAIHVQVWKQIGEESKKCQQISVGLEPVEVADMTFDMNCVEELRQLCRRKIKLQASVKRKVVWVDPKIGNSENSNYVRYLKTVEGVCLHATASASDALEVLCRKEPGVEYRAVTAGTGGKEFIQILRTNNILCPVLVFCGSFDWHSKWARKFENVEVTVDPSRMCQFATWERL